jgi:hypothetical protein
MASFTDIWFGLQQAGKPTPYLLIDCAGIEGGEARLPKHIFSELECLFTGDLAIELADVGPYLGRLQSFGPDVASAVEDLLSRHVGMLVVLEDNSPDQAVITFSQLHRHFRKFNVVYGPESKPLFFRYYDPRAVVDVLKVFDTKQLDVFYGPVTTFVFFDQTGQAVRCQRQGGVVAISS